MTQEEILKVISDNFLCVRRLPFEVVYYWKYIEGDENKKWVAHDGSPSKSVKSLVIKNWDLEWFEKTKPYKYERKTPKERYEEYVKRFPNGMKMLKEVRTIDKGGWWYVKECQNTDSQVHFREVDFFAPTLEEAIKLYLKSKYEQYFSSIY